MSEKITKTIRQFPNTIRTRWYFPLALAVIAILSQLTVHHHAIIAIAAPWALSLVAITGFCTPFAIGLNVNNPDLPCSDLAIAVGGVVTGCLWGPTGGVQQYQRLFEANNETESGAGEGGDAKHL